MAALPIRHRLLPARCFTLLLLLLLPLGADVNARASVSVRCYLQSEPCVCVSLSSVLLAHQLAADKS